MLKKEEQKPVAEAEPVDEGSDEIESHTVANDDLGSLDSVDAPASPGAQKVVDAEKDVRVAVVAAKALKKVVRAESLVVAPDAEKDAKLISTSKPWSTCNTPRCS